MNLNSIKGPLQIAYEKVCDALKIYFETLVVSNELVRKLAISYFNWIALKTTLVQNENDFKIPFSALPNTFTSMQRDWLLREKQAVFDKYYRFDSSTNKYIINVKKQTYHMKI